jgi:hypothetical protein
MPYTLLVLHSEIESLVSFGQLACSEPEIGLSSIYLTASLPLRELCGLCIIIAA